MKKREQLGNLIQGPMEYDDGYRYGLEEYLRDLPRSCARILSLSGNCDLIFVGRSLEKTFDYLSGVLAGTLWETKLSLLNVSLQESHDAVIGQYPGAVDSFRAQLSSLDINPLSIRPRENGIAFVDIIVTGNTFGNLHEFMMKISDVERVDRKSVKRKMHFIAGTEEKHTSPNTFRWYQDPEYKPWLSEYKPSQLKSFTIPPLLWNYIVWGNQRSLSECNPPWRWTDESIEYAHHDKKSLESLRLCYGLYVAATSSEHRQAFLRLLQKENSVKYSWFRGIISELKKSISKQVY